MCGIAGMIDAKLGREEGEALLERMLRSISHRGPDYSSSWQDMPVLLGHNRLSIIDLSDRANQPMAYDGLVIVYNGEIYNYLEIRQELEQQGYKFGTASDTEVILAAYRKWGANCVTRFVGMWAFAIWDTANKELFCSRDRFGIKPFYYIHSGDRFYFGSEYAPLKLSPIFNSTFDLDQVSRGLRLGVACYQDATYFKCLKALPGRCNLVFKEGKVSVTPYWDIDGARKFHGTFEEKRERFRELFRDSVRLHMRSDVAVGGMLSGGMDSSSIASVVGHDFPTVPFKTFTIYYEGRGQMDERAWASEVTSVYSNLEPVHHAPSDREVAECFDVASRAYELPLRSSPTISSYFVMKLASRSNIKVLMGGEGADEYLAGYTPAYDRFLGGQIKTMQWLSGSRSMREICQQNSLKLKGAALLGLTSLSAALASEELIWRVRSRYQFARLTRGGIPSHLYKFNSSRLNEYLYHLLFHTLLPSFLHSVDRMSMAFSIECRVPFLDHRLVEFAFALSDDDKIRHGQTKYVLKRSMEGIVPNAILARRDKQPFVGQEMTSWLSGPLKHLLDQPIKLDGLGVDTREASRAILNFKRGDRNRVRLVWRLAMLNHWANRQ